jgi:hypothetical protein
VGLERQRQGLAGNLGQAQAAVRVAGVDHLAAGHQVTEAAAVAVEQAAEQPDHVAQRQHVHRAQQVAYHRRGPAQRGPISGHHLQPEQALARGGAPAPFADDGVAPGDAEHHDQEQADPQLAQYLQRAAQQGQQHQADDQVHQPGQCTRQRTGGNQRQGHPFGGVDHTVVVQQGIHCHGQDRFDGKAQHFTGSTPPADSPVPRHRRHTLLLPAVRPCPVAAPAQGTAAAFTAPARSWPGPGRQG